MGQKEKEKEEEKETLPPLLFRAEANAEANLNPSQPFP